MPSAKSRGTVQQLVFVLRRHNYSLKRTAAYRRLCYHAVTRQRPLSSSVSAHGPGFSHLGHVCCRGARWRGVPSVCPPGSGPCQSQRTRSLFSLAWAGVACCRSGCTGSCLCIAALSSVGSMVVCVRTPGRYNGVLVCLCRWARYNLGYHCAGAHGFVRSVLVGVSAVVISPNCCGEVSACALTIRSSGPLRMGCGRLLFTAAAAA